MFKRLINLKWLGLGIVVVGLVLGLSVRSYIISQNRQDVEIFQTGSASCVRDGGGNSNSCYIKTTQGNICTVEGFKYGCGMECCAIVRSVCCCMGCFPLGTDCNSPPYNCKSPTSPSPKVSPSPSPSPSASPSPSPTKMCDEDGSFTTTSGFRYCFIFKAPKTTYEQMQTECKTYGELAKLTDGETKKDVLDIIAAFLPLRSKLAAGFEGGGGPTIFETCQALVKKFGNDQSLFAENGYGGITCGKTNDIPHKLIFDKEAGNQNGRLNDTNGRNDILGGLCQMAKASPSPSVSPSPSPGTKPKFHIRNFNDLDGDGEKDANEGSTNIVWSYQYRVNDRDWIAIETDATTGLSVNKPFDKDTKIEVEQLNKDDWTITTPSKQAQTLSVDGKIYVFDFGNKQGGIGGPNPTPGLDNASFIIHKFLDANKNGVRDSGEESTGRTWVFAYQINGGDKKEYKVEAGKTIGDIITVKKNDVIKVGELGQEGWLNTTGAEVTKTLSEPITYTVYFGNWPVSGVVPPTFPPKQPDTGTPTWLTLGALGLVAGLLLVKKYGFR